MNIGSRIRLLRERAGLSGERFGELIDVSKGTISNWESGQTPPLAKLVELRKHVFFSFDWLIDGDVAKEQEATYKITTPESLQQETIRLLSGMDIDDAALWLETARIGANKARRISAIQPTGLSPEEEDILNHLRKTTLNQDKIQLIKDLIKAKITPEETTQPERKRAAG